MEYFTFNNVSSETLGVLMQDEFLDSTPAISFEEIDIPGRDGAVIEIQNLKNVLMDIKCTLRDSANRDAVRRWLHGTGDFIFNGRKRRAFILGQIDCQRIGTEMEAFTLSVIFEPFWYPESDELTSIGSAAGTYTVTNTGTVASVPIISITGTGTITLSINGTSVQITAGDTEVTLIIDSKSKTLTPTGIANLGWRYPTLNPGSNEITVTGSITDISIGRKDRWF